MAKAINAQLALFVTKFCSACKRHLPCNDFALRAEGRGGYRSRCRACTAAKRRQSYHEPQSSRREVTKAAQAAKVEARHATGVTKCPVFVAWMKELNHIRYMARREAALAQSAAYRADHKAEETANRAAHYQRNKKAVNASNEAYRKAHPELYAAAFAKRRAAQRNATPSWVDHAEIAKFYAEAARLTRETGEAYHVDHIVPLQSKVVCGLHCPANLRVIRAFDNISKGNKLIPELLAS